MSQRTSRLWVVLGLLLFTPALAFAQASLSGTVKDASGAVLPGVSVEASSPVLIEKVRSTVTDETGQYRIVDLRPGVYKVTFTLSGFSTVEREGIELTGRFNATVNADLKVGALEERVTVTGATPVVDLENTRQQRTVSTAVLDAIPSSQTVLGVATLIPGVINNISDVGGTNTNSNQQITIHGGRTTDYKTTIDGFGIGNSYNYVSALQPNFAGTQEITVDAGASSAEQSAGGIVVNVVPKDGGNQFSGGLIASWANNNLQADNFTQRVADKGLKVVNTLKHVYDINPSFGGPIKRDKVWFYATYRANVAENYAGGMYYNLNAGNPNLWTYVPDTSRPAFNSQTQYGGSGRVTWQANAKQKFTGYWDQQQRCVCQQVAANIAPEAANEFWYPLSYLGTISWTYTATNRMLIQAGYSARREDYEYPLRGDKAPENKGLIPVSDQVTSLQYHGQGNASTLGEFVSAENRIPKMRASVLYSRARHELKVGFDNQWIDYTDYRADNDYGLSYVFSGGLPNTISQRAMDYATGLNLTDLGIYAQDKWSWNRLTVNGGLRLEVFRTHFPDFHFGPTVNAPTRNFSVPASDWHHLEDIVPRLGAVYDLFGNGKTAIKGTANKYVAAISGALSFPGSPSLRQSDTATRAWTDGLSGPTALPEGDPRRGNFVVDCDRTSPAANLECGALSNALFAQQIPTLTYDPATYTGYGSRGYNWEFSLGVQQQLMPRVSMDVGYFRRVYGNLLVTDNVALAPADYDRYSITAPVDARLPNGGGYVISDLFDLKPEKVAGGVPSNNLQTFAKNYGDQIEHWNGTDVNFNARLPRGVVLQGGFSTGRVTTDNCDVVTKLDNPSTLYCHVEGNWLTDVKAVGSYLIPKVDVRLSGTFQSVAGQPISASYIVQNAEVQKTLPRGLSGGRTTVAVNIVEPNTMYVERINQVDLRFSKLFKWGRSHITGNLDLYNAFNNDTILSQSNAYGNWQTPFSLILGRFVKFGAQLEF